MDFQIRFPRDQMGNMSAAGHDIHLWTHPWLTEFLLYGAAQYSDPYLLGEYLKLRDLDRAWTAIDDIIWHDPGLVPKGPESLPPIRYLGGSVGTLLFRTGWGMDDVVGMFKVLPLFAKNHDHLDRLSFQIYCRGALALDSGLYEGSNSLYDSDHWLNYLQRTIAHNTLVIRDPAICRRTRSLSSGACSGGRRSLRRGVPGLDCGHA